MDRSQPDGAVTTTQHLEPGMQPTASRTGTASEGIARWRHAACLIAGFVIGMAIGLFVFERVALFGLTGACVGVLGSELLQRWQHRKAD
ncbi:MULTISPECIES: hypothetical protein [Luteimonas]|uniref:hypothetical protein n=1 Tax=Luteimonas TaxID=83614 RepID=UPI001180DDB2|nr:MULTISPECIES: hypothetical protein [Luteimonas]